MNNYDRIAQTIQYIIANADKQSELDEIAENINLSPYHFRRLFSQWAGISPKRFLQTLTIEHAKELITNSESTSNISHKTEPGNSARLHDNFVSIKAIILDENKSQDRGLKITYGIHETLFGYASIAITEHGICHLAFTNDKNTKTIESDLNQKWQVEKLHRSDQTTKPFIDDIFKRDHQSSVPLSLYVKGTDFQVNVWRALLQISSGKLHTYGQLAKKVGNPNAAQAVGQALRANLIAFLIPCHRVILASGKTGNYRWGNIRKRAMLAWETGIAKQPV